jgi:uncharacterized protein YndB with AHSA1/START domain
MPAAQQTHQLRLVRSFNATPQEVYDAWTTPEAIREFFIPKEGTKIAQVEMDVRPGGRYVIEMITDGVTHHKAVGEFKEVIPGRRLVYTWSRPGDSASCAGPSAATLENTLITIDFNAKGEGTEMVFVHDFFPSEIERDNHRNGWSSILDHLTGYRVS